MPTAGRLAGAALFAPLFWYLSQIAAPYFIAAETAVPDWFAIINTALFDLGDWNALEYGTGQEAEFDYPKRVG